MVRAIRRRDVAQHVGGGAHPVQIVRSRAAPRRPCVCSRIPSGRCRRAASYAAARERSRPTVSGNTIPGNSTTLRTGTMISASSGSARDVLVASRSGARTAASAPACASVRSGVSFAVVDSFMAFPSAQACASRRIRQPSASSRVPISSRASGNRMRRSKYPYGISSRRNAPAAMPRTAGSARRAPRARRLPSSPRCGAAARREARRGRRSRARPRRRRPAAPMSRALAPEAARRKNCRCIRSASSITSQACAHIQSVGNRGAIGAPVLVKRWP